MKRKRKNIFITNEKIFSHLETIYNWKKGADVFPITIEVHLTERCNNRCFYCNYPKTPKDIGLDDFKIVIKKLSQIKTRSVILSGGGEPTLHQDISDAIKTIAKSEMDSAIITNLLVRDEHLYKTIIKHCTWCRISLDSSNEGLYKKIRGGQ